MEPPPPSDGKPARWALVYTAQFDGFFLMKRIPERLIQDWRDFGWTLLICDSQMRFLDVDEVRREDERGRR